MRLIQGTCNRNLRMSHLKKKTNQLDEKTCSNRMSLHLDSETQKRKSSQEKKTREKKQEDLSGLDHKHNLANPGVNLTLDNFCL